MCHDPTAKMTAVTKHQPNNGGSISGYLQHTWIRGIDDYNEVIKKKMMKFDDGCSMPYDDDRSITNGQYDDDGCSVKSIVMVMISGRWVQFFRLIMGLILYKNLTSSVIIKYGMF